MIKIKREAKVLHHLKKMIRREQRKAERKKFRRTKNQLLSNYSSKKQSILKKPFCVRD
jgi:hypothetical protein